MVCSPELHVAHFTRLQNMSPRDQRGKIWKRFSRIYPSNRIYGANLGLLPLTAHNSETGFPKYTFNKLTLFGLCEKLRGDLEEEWVNEFFSSRIFCLSPKLFLPPALPLPPSLPTLPTPPSSGTLFTA